MPESICIVFAGFANKKNIDNTVSAIIITSVIINHFGEEDLSDLRIVISPLIISVIPTAATTISTALKNILLFMQIDI